MLEPLTVLSVAANVAQFIDFSTKLASGARELSANGSLSENAALEVAVHELSSFAAELESAASQTVARSRDENSLKALATSCKEVAEELLAVLGKLKTKSPGKRWDTALKALKSIWKAKQIEDLERRLNFFSNQLALHLFRLFENRQSSLRISLESLTSQHEQFGMQTSETLGTLRKDILNAISKDDGTVKDDVDLSPLCASIRNLVRETEIESKEQKILVNLDFGAMGLRHSNIVDAHKNTFDWMLEEDLSAQSLSPPYLVPWLQNENGIFWVVGKAGSGKSTLFKYLCSNNKVKDALEHWSKPHNLIVASFFFWNAGTDLQKSQEGLLRTLLYDILRQVPSAISRVAPQRWQDVAERESRAPEWTRKELFDMFNKLIEQDLGDAKFCFFIDGLDEFEGDHEDIAALMISLASLPNIKICVSSRPWNPFSNAFTHTVDRKLVLQDYTRSDIRRYVEDNLEGTEYFRRVQARDERYQDLVSELVDRAQGVFLWVFLVVRSLRRGLTNADTIPTLQRRLREFPQDLNSYFRHILDSIEPFYRRQTSELLLMSLKCAEPLPLLSLAVIDNHDQEFYLEHGFEPVDERNPSEKFLDMERRLNAYCKDLMEISINKYSHPMFRHEISFLHRTVKDFLLDRSIHSILVERAKADLDIDRSLCEIYLFLLKVLHPSIGQYESDTEIFRDPAFVYRFRYVILFIVLHSCELEWHRGINDYEYVEAAEQAVSALKIKGQTLFRDRKVPSVLQTAIEMGLYGYVKQKFKSPAAASLIYSVDGMPPLQVALGRAVLLSELGSEAEDSKLKILCLLLDAGASPNQLTNNGQSVWHQFLIDVYNDRGAAKPQIRRRWVRNIELLLQYGAEVKNAEGGGGEVKWITYRQLEDTDETGDGWVQGIPDIQPEPTEYTGFHPAYANSPFNDECVDTGYVRSTESKSIKEIFEAVCVDDYDLQRLMDLLSKRAASQEAAAEGLEKEEKEGENRKQALFTACISGRSSFFPAGDAANDAAKGAAGAGDAELTSGADN